MWATSSKKRSAEWVCTGCGTTNRKLLPPGATTGEDRCVHCEMKHDISIGETTVRWEAKQR